MNCPAGFGRMAALVMTLAMAGCSHEDFAESLNNLEVENAELNGTTWSSVAGTASIPISTTAASVSR